MRYVILLFLIACLNIIQAQKIFQLPVDNGSPWPTNCCEFSEYCAYANVVNQCQYGGTGYHNGIDFTNTGNEPIYASNSGRCIYTGYKSDGLGNVAVIEHELSDGNYLLTMYAHMQNSCLFNKGDLISKGSIIGYEGATGGNYADHLHFETKHSYNHELDGDWGATDYSDHRRAITGPFIACSNSNGHPGYTPVDLGCSIEDFGFIDPRSVLESSNYLARNPINILTELSTLELITGEPVNVSVNFETNYKGTWHEGRLYLELLDSDKNWLGDLDNDGFFIQDFPAFNFTANFSRTEPITSEPGLYKIRVTYSNGSNFVSHTQRQSAGFDYVINPRTIQIQEPDCISGVAFEDEFDNCNEENWNYSNGTWAFCSGNNYAFNYLRQYDESENYARARMIDDISVENYESYTYTTTLELEQDYHSGSRVRLEIVDGRVELDFKNKRVKFRYAGNSSSRYFNLREDRIYIVRVRAYPTYAYLDIDGVALFTISGNNDWDDDRFDIKTYYSDLKVYSVKIEGVCGQSFQSINIGESYTDNSFKETRLYVNAYPNPSNGNITFSSSVSGRLEVIDLNGRLIQQLKLNSEERKTIQIINKGIYYYRFMPDIGDLKIGKLLVQ